jgi:CDP-diacylglycerol--glycerol-3-phosphate 3-phosphatidyltransferase/cardiolipin synthase
MPKAASTGDCARRVLIVRGPGLIPHNAGVTVATQITFVRILLIPVFVGFAIYYARSAAAGAPEDWMRFVAIGTFVLAAVSDAVDGWIARRFRQESNLGRLLDPIADKLLLVAAVLVLSLSSWPAPLPLWFVIVLISREVLLTLGTYIVDHVVGKVHIRPHWTGKLATCLQIVTVAGAMLHLKQVVLWAALPATLFTAISATLYFADGARQAMALPPKGGQS